MLKIVGQVYGSKLWCVRGGEDAACAINEAKFPFDCFVVNRSVEMSANNKELIDAIAWRTSDWVEVFGVNAESIHDAIDEASVSFGRQVDGEGKPMTSWHDEIATDSDIASYILTGGQGHSPNKLIVVIGSREEEESLISELHNRRSKQLQEDIH